ncbi:MAG: hypothetical protein HZB39_01490 [Planctomycetes bacterium]|nr:hypothetical protein [Planctomycetota bacterium]
MTAPLAGLFAVLATATLASQDGLVLREVARLAAPGGTVCDHDVAADGTRLASLGECGDIVVRDLERGLVLARLPAGAVRFRRVRLVPGRDAVLLATDGPRVWRWDWSEGQAVRLDVPAFTARELVALDDRRFAMTCAAIGGTRVLVYELDDGGAGVERVRRNLPLRGLRLSVALTSKVLRLESPDGTEMTLDATTLADVDAPAAPARVDVRVHREKGGGLVVEQPGRTSRWNDHEGTPRQLAFSPDGRYLAIAGNNAVDVVRAEDGKHVARLDDGVAVAPARDGPEFWIATKAGARRWHAAARRNVGTALRWPEGFSTVDQKEDVFARIASVGEQGIVAVLRAGADSRCLVLVDESGGHTIRTEVWDFAVDLDSRRAIVHDGTGLVVLDLDAVDEDGLHLADDVRLLTIEAQTKTLFTIDRLQNLDIWGGTGMERHFVMMLRTPATWIGTRRDQVVVLEPDGRITCVPWRRDPRGVPIPGASSEVRARKSPHDLRFPAALAPVGDRIAWCEGDRVVLAALGESR